jgi:hypothetical protein
MSKKIAAPAPVPASERPFPSAQTLFRVVGLGPDFEKMLESVFQQTAKTFSPQELVASRRIQQAQTPFQAVTLTIESRGLAQMTWTQRMNEFGAAAIPAMVRRLKSSQSIREEDDRHIVVERIIGALARLGQPGGQALWECFNNLDDYSQSMACVALGLLHIDAASDAIWRYYQRVRASASQQREHNYVVGALWGLIDLQHPQVDAALAALLADPMWPLFAEQYGFAARAGGVACVPPLVARLHTSSTGQGRYKDENADVMMALIGMGQRLGADSFAALLRECIDNEDGVLEIVAAVVSRSAEDVRDYFALYYTNPNQPDHTQSAPQPADLDENSNASP